MNCLQTLARWLDGDRDDLYRTLSTTQHLLNMARARNETLMARLAESEQRAECSCNDVVHMRVASENAQLASENARLRTALGEPMEAKK